MSQYSAPGRQDAVATATGWVLAIVFTALFFNATAMPRTPLDEREGLRALHYTLGIAVLALALFRLYWWRSGPRPAAPEGMPAGAFGLSRLILLALLLTFIATALVGFSYAQSNGHHVTLFGIDVPQLLPKSYAAKTTLGYLHSALGFYYVALLLLWLGVGIYHHLRYRAGLLRLLPGSRV